MRKLALDLDSLVVDSFGTEPARAGEGTVLGQATDAWGTCYTDCVGGTCPGCSPSSIVLCATAGCGSGRDVDTCYETCNTCADSCNGIRSCLNTCAASCWESCYGECYTEDPCIK